MHHGFGYFIYMERREIERKIKRIKREDALF